MSEPTTNRATPCTAEPRRVGPREVGAALGILLAFAVGFALAFMPLAFGMRAHAEWVIVSASFVVTLLGLVVIVFGLLQLVRARAES